jgi:hypothetical protein
MTEAWLLVSEQAIRHASGNPNGTENLAMPALRAIEKIANPKELLRDKLRLASGLPSRRLRKFDPDRLRRRVAELIPDMTVLRALPSFQRFENEATAAIAHLV